MSKEIRIAGGQGFWGDSLDAPISLINKGDIDYLVLEYLAEVTMSILSKQYAKDSNLGYVKDFPDLIASTISNLKNKNLKIITNAGGVNPRACASKVYEVLKNNHCERDLKIAVVEGDNIRGRIDELLSEGVSFSNFDSSEPFSNIKENLQTANVYCGAKGIVDALDDGADIIITGRVADASLTLGPLIHEFDWKYDDWNKLAAGTVAGHLIECGAQVSGGNLSCGWQSVSLENIGYPIVRVRESGGFVIYKHAETGGLINEASVKEQLLYEVGDPENYITPDVVVDFTTLNLKEVAKNEIEISNVRGKEKPKTLKVSMSYFDSYMTEGSILYSWPDAYKKSVAAEKIIRSRMKANSVKPDRVCVEHIGIDACHGRHTQDVANLVPEVRLRIAVSDKDRSTVKAFSRMMAPLVLNGPPSATAYSGGKGAIRELFGFWPSLIDRKHIDQNYYIYKG